MKKRPYILDCEPFEPFVRKKRNLRPVLAAAGLLVLIAVILLLCLRPSEPKQEEELGLSMISDTVFNREGDGKLHAYFLDVGQGDCIYLESPDGKTMLVDAGEKESYPAIELFLQSHGVERLDTVVATHMHNDHIGGMADVLANFEVGTFYMPDQAVNSDAYTELMAILTLRDIPVVKAKVLPSDIGPMVMDWSEKVEVLILSPFDGNYTEENDYSIVMRIAFGESSALLTGDAETTAERIILKAFSYRYVMADVLKVGHHGSKYSTCDAFLTKVDPSIAVISVGEGNEYGHPSDEVTGRLHRYGIGIYRTDRDGTVHVSLDGTTAQVVE